MAALCSAFMSMPAFAQEGSDGVNLTRGQALDVARQALASERPDVAFSIAQGLLQADPTDPQAHLIIAVLARGRGELDTAAEAATLAWRNAETRPERFDAAFLAGDIAARQERWTSSQIWLRRADQYAPNEVAEDAIARAYRGVSARNPLKVQLSFTVRPSDNLNNGSDPDDEVVGLFGLAGTTEEKIAGVEVAVGAALSYRLSESATHRTEALAQTYMRRAILESGAVEEFNETTPFDDITRNEFDYATLSFGLSHRQAVFDGLGPSGIRATVGASYYRNGHLSNFGEIAVTQDVRRGEDGLLRFGLALRDETRFDAPISSYVSQAASVDWFSRGPGGLSYSLGTTFTYYDSDGGTTKGRQLATRAKFALGRSIWGATPDLSLGLTLRDLPEYAGGFGRTDVTARATLGLTYEDASFYGFKPRVELSASDTNSSEDLWDRRSFGVGATLVSRF